MDLYQGTIQVPTEVNRRFVPDFSSHNISLQTPGFESFMEPVRNFSRNCVIFKNVNLLTWRFSRKWKWLFPSIFWCVKMLTNVLKLMKQPMLEFSKQRKKTVF